jgi:predicted dienelactone hydrolase
MKSIAQSLTASRSPVDSPARRRLLVASVGAPIAAALPVSGWASPSSVDLDWNDTARGRAVPVRLHLPVNRPASTPAPLVVFSHGLGGSRFGYTWLGNHFAEHGIACLHVQHVGSDRSIWAERGNPLTLLGLMRDATSEQEAIARVHDIRFALNQLQASGFGANIDTSRVVAAGHSYGANTSMLISGARIERQDSTTRLADHRIAAAILISAPPFHGEGAPEPILSPIKIPTLHVTATEDIIRVPGFFSDLDDRLAIFKAVAGRDKTLAVYAGGSHSMFTDRIWPGGEALNRSVKLATRELATGFVERILRGHAVRLDGWPDRHAAILDRFIDSPARST